MRLAVPEHLSRPSEMIIQILSVSSDKPMRLLCGPAIGTCILIMISVIILNRMQKDTLLWRTYQVSQLPLPLSSTAICELTHYNNDRAVQILQHECVVIH